MLIELEHRLYDIFTTPGKPAEFGPYGLEGYRVEARRASQQLVDALIFHEPNGTFVAQRVVEPGSR